MVFVIFVRIAAAGIFWHRFVEDWLADYVFFAGPIAEVEEAATLAAEWEIGARFGVGWFAADGAERSHRDTNKTNTNSFVMAARGSRQRFP